jgi:hypothetical protein
MAKLIFDDDEYRQIQRRLDAGLAMPRRVAPLAIASQQAITITREADNTLRWSAIAAVAAVNRVGEIDSTELFTNFVSHAKLTGDLPDLIFHHLWSGLPKLERMSEAQKYNVELARRELARITNEDMANEMIVTGNDNHWLNFRLGWADEVFRAGYAYVAVGTLDVSNPFAHIIAARFKTEPTYYGTSIGYQPMGEPQLVRSEKSANFVAVYNNGINHEISVLPERYAASVLTQVKVN